MGRRPYRRLLGPCALAVASLSSDGSVTVPYCKFLNIMKNILKNIMTLHGLGELKWVGHSCLVPQFLSKAKAELSILRLASHQDTLSFGRCFVKVSSTWMTVKMWKRSTGSVSVSTLGHPREHSTSPGCEGVSAL